MPAVNLDPKLLTLLNVFALARSTREELASAAAREPRELSAVAPTPAPVLARIALCEAATPPFLTFNS